MLINLTKPIFDYWHSLDQPFIKYQQNTQSGLNQGMAHFQTPFQNALNNNMQNLYGDQNSTYNPLQNTNQQNPQQVSSTPSMEEMQ